MRVALLSDIHGTLPALQAVVADLERRGVERVVTLGDHVSGPLLPLETARYLMARDDWIHIAGNHERQLLDDDLDAMGASDRHARDALDGAALAWLAALPIARALHDLLICHGTPTRDDRFLLVTIERDGTRRATDDEIAERLGAVDAAVIACGHSHVPRMRAHGASLLVNPGSVGLQAYDDDEPHAYRVEIGTPHARYAILDSGDDGWTCDLLAIDYDHHAMAELARANGRPEWGHALDTGRMP